MNYSIIMPVEQNRIELLNKTIAAYEKFIDYNKEDVEFVFVSRTIKSLEEIERPNISISAKLINYTWNEKTFAPSIALNLGVKHAKYENIIITCPEVRPLTNVLEQFNNLGRGNYISQVFDCAEKGGYNIICDSITGSLVNKNFRGHSPCMYFLALFKKEDLELINGWDNSFMKGYCYEDDDFGLRFLRAGLKFEVRDEIQAEHQWHKRGAQSGNDQEELSINLNRLNQNNQNKVIRPTSGLNEVDEWISINL